MIYEKIKTIYPELTDHDFMTVITLQNNSDGKGDYIAKCRPTQEQLA
jgi:hypothetical protein